MSEQTNPTTDTTAGRPDGEFLVTQRVAAPPDAVFPFLVEPERMVRWMGTEARLTPEPGGEFWLDMNGTDVAVGTFTEVNPPRRVVFTWGWDGSADVPPGSSTVEIDLVADGDDTIVELRHSGLRAPFVDTHGEGWNYFLPFLVRLFDTD